MDVPSPSMESCQPRNQQKNEDNSDCINGGSSEFVPVQVDSSGTGQLRTSPEDATDAPDLQNPKTAQVALENTSKSMYREKKASSNLVTRKYALRSSSEGASGHQAKTVGACENAHTCIGSVDVSNERRNGRQRRKRINEASKDKFFSLRKRFRYLLTRVSYEQSLIEAYSGEGWKGQSLEKLRPEKELQRATSEILRRKLEMRELVKHLDVSRAEGKLQASLFDSQGQIYCEDIFCAKCGSKDSSTYNDIILCDGCERGFHQMCLVPPLLNEEIPPGDEMWLCPACKCKVYCIDLLNDMQGTHLSIQDMWEKVFPEATGDKQCAEFVEPDDSQDDDYDPAGQGHNEDVSREFSGSEESDFTSASDDLNDSASDEQRGRPGFSSGDSEDNDYDPSGLDIEEMVQKEGSSSNVSDFTSESDGLGALIDDESTGADKDPLSFSAGCSEPVTSSHQGRLDTVIKEKESSLDCEQPSMLEPGLCGKNALPASRKRHRERLDYKKLYDEAFGNVPSNSSGDEDWTDMNTKKVKNDDFMSNNAMSSEGNIKTVRSKNFKMSQSTCQKENILAKPNNNQVGGTENTSDRLIHQKLESEVKNHSVAKPLEDSPKPDSIGNQATTSGSRFFGKVISQRLYESFKVNNYPSRETKDNLSRELGITVRQIGKWFENARRSFRLSADKEGSIEEKGTTNNDPVLAELDPDPRNGDV